ADAWIEITPATATNLVGQTHTLTITVHAVNGTLKAGTATATLLAGSVGSFVGSPTCNYTGGAASASCTVQITSAQAGTSTVQATSDIGITGTTGTLTRTTGTQTNIDHGCNPANNGCANAVKQWADAWIQISPQEATNPVGTTHTLTITVHSVNGNLKNGTATATILPGSVGSFVPGQGPTCSYTGGGTAASCTVQITSNVAGDTTVQASSDIGIVGTTGTLTRTTGTVT